MGKKVIFLFVLILLPFISAQPPFSTTSIDFPDGYVLVTSEIYYIQQNQPHQFNFFVYNKTDGKLQDNSTIECTFYLADSFGEVILFSDVPYFPNGHWGIDILGGNFSNIGLYAYGLKCEDGVGGAMTGTWEATYSGKEFTPAQAILYLSLFLILLGFILTVFYMIMRLPDSNERDEEGKIMSISYLKHLRTTLWLVEWMLMVTTLYLASNLAFAHLTEQLFAKILFTLFQITFALTPIMVIVMVMYIFVRFYHDKQFQSLLNRGIFPQGRL
jgi:flagellar biogenesis protein FliO